MAKQLHTLTRDPTQKAILKALDTLSNRSGRRPPEVWDDWLDLVHATLDALPRLTLACVRNERFVDTDETLALHERLKERYTTLEYFKQALHALLSTTDDMRDHLGEMFMAWGAPSQWHGQFFTPWELALLVAKMSGIEGVADEVHTRLKAAANTCPFAQATLITGMMIEEQEEGEEWLFTRVLPAILRTGNFQPVTIYDPTVGSGVMLLAAASLIPRWMTHYNLVQFFGQDIDRTCVQMARITMMLYGLNGYGVRAMLAAQGISPDDAPVVDVAAPAVEVPAPAPAQEVGADPPLANWRRKGVTDGQLSFDFLLEL